MNGTPLTTVVSYPERGEGGNNRYRGNCSPKLVEDLLRFYHPSQICDYMVGSGTTFAAAGACGIPCHGYDLNRGFDLLSCDIPERSDFTFWHPPYADIITYSDVMYSAKEVKEKYGFDPCVADLSRIKDWDEFIKALNYCCIKQFSALEKGGRLAVLMGDIKKHRTLYSMLADIAKPGTLEQIIIKKQHNCVSDRRSYSGRFIPIVHEYLMIVRKDDALMFPVKLTRTIQADMRDIRSLHGGMSFMPSWSSEQAYGVCTRFMIVSRTTKRQRQTQTGRQKSGKPYRCTLHCFSMMGAGCGGWLPEIKRRKFYGNANNQSSPLNFRRAEVHLFAEYAA